MSIDFTANCGICLDPLSNGKKIGCHVKHRDEFGQICDGSLHPTHLECALDAIEQSSMNCSTCRVPLNLKSILKLIGVPTRTISVQKIQQFKYVSLLAGAYLGAFGGMFLAWQYFPTLPLVSSWIDLGSDSESVDMVWSTSLSCVTSTVLGGLGILSVGAKILNHPKFNDAMTPIFEKMGWGEDLYDDRGAKMISVDGKPPENSDAHTAIQYIS